MIREESSSSTPLASSRRRVQLQLPSKIPNRVNKTVRWSNQLEQPSPTQEVSPCTRPNARESGVSDVFGKLSLSMANLRAVKQKLNQKESELKMAVEEKEKYEADHSRLYSQLSSLRSKTRVFETQLAKKAEQCQELEIVNEDLARECSRLRSLIAEDTSRQTLRIKTLENQLRQLRDEVSNKNYQDEFNKTIETLQDENDRLVTEHDRRLEMERADKARISKELDEFRKVTEELTKRVEESRSSMSKLSTEKTLLTQDVQRLKEEQAKYLEAGNEIFLLQERLAELETERSNAKTALRKALVIMDENDELLNKVDQRDEKIKELEKLLHGRTVQLPSMESLSGSMEHLGLKSIEKEKHISDLVDASEKSPKGTFIDRLNDVKTRMEQGSSSALPKYAIPKATQSVEEKLRAKLSALSNPISK